MRKLFFTLFTTAVVINLSAQTVERVLVLNEGYFDYVSNEIVTPVSVGAYDPETDTYAMIDEIENARFATDIRLDGDFYYVAADKYLIKYDRYTDELINSVEIEGIRKIAFWNDYVIVTRGEYLTTFDSYIQVYDKNTLDFVFEIPAIDVPYASEGVVVKEGIAYVAVNNGFVWGGEVGYIAEIDLAYQTLTDTISLGVNGKNPDNIMIDGDNIFTLNNKDYTGSSVSSYKIGTGDLSTTDLINVSAGCGTSVYYDGNIYYQELFNSVVTKYDPVAESIVDESDFEINFYAIAFDEINDLMYASETDYFSYGKVNMYDETGVLVNSFNVGISPGNILFDVRTGTAVEDISTNQIQISPNPATEQIEVNGINGDATIQVFNSAGELILETSENQLFVAALPQGIYFVKTEVNGQLFTSDFVKQ